MNGYCDICSRPCDPDKDECWDCINEAYQLEKQQLPYRPAALSTEEFNQFLALHTLLGQVNQMGCPDC